MSDFSHNSNYAKQNAFRSVKFGADSQLLETELNEMQDIQAEARADIVRESIPSGFTTLSDLDYAFMATNPNQIKTLSDSVAFVNGYKITIPSGTVIQLDAPPTYDPVAKTGTPSRDDLVFLEVWLQEVKNGDTIYSGGGDGQAIITPIIEDSRVGEETSRRIQLRWRIRVVDGVDFSQLPEGVGAVGSPALNELDIPFGLGGSNLSNSDIASNLDANYRYTHQFHKEIQSSWNVTDPLINDVGLYRAGYTKGYPIENTADGFSYAIPMFKVHRRNSGGYSTNNGNGSITYTKITFTRPTSIEAHGIGQYTVSVSDYTNISVNDIFMMNSIPQWKILSKNDNNTVTVLNLSNGIQGTGTISVVKYTRPDILLADIVDDRDILDLRHQVSLTGFNYQELLEENFDKLLRGELQTKERTKMLKTYHGIPKTPIDANTVFYASLDGTTTAEVGGNPTGGSCSFRTYPTGLGFKDNGSDLYYTLLNGMPSEFTIDYWGFSAICLTKGKCSISNNYDTGIILGSDMCLFKGVVYNTGLILSKNNMYLTHNRYTYKDGIFKAYINGQLRLNISIDLSSYLNTLDTLNLFQYSTKRGTEQRYSDLSVSNIDRGSTFATLPQDFIDGYARISPAFNSQRNVFSDALTTETKQELINVDGTKNKPYIHLGDATDWIKDDSTKWNAGDKVKLDTLTGEIITGVIDADTAIAKIVEVISSNNGDYRYKLNDVSKIVVNDKLTCIDGSYLIITAIDTTTNIITGESHNISEAIYAGLLNYAIGDLLYETTASSSSPLVKFNATGTLQSGGTNTITLPSTYNINDNFYNGFIISIDSGTGAGQVKTITDYVGSTKVATVDSNWTTQPDNTSVITIHNIDVGGTWSGLGTTEAIYTLPATLPSGLTNQSLALTYAMTEMSGQGGIPEVLTQTLAGEYKGDKLIPNPAHHILDDFQGKVAGSVIENPNIGRRTNGNGSQTSLLLPLSHNEAEMELGVNDSGITNIEKLDGSSIGTTTNITNAIPQHLFAFNLIEIVERKYGVIPGSTMADKVTWLKNNLASITCNWWGYGSCPSGNKAELKRFNFLSGTWSTVNISHTLNYSSLLTYSDLSYNLTTATLIDSNGFIYYLAYTDASDGTTPSTIYTDYINIEVTLKIPTGYDVLAPENLRRDAGKSNIILVRKETKEIQLMLGSGDNLNGIITYGNTLINQSVTKQTGNIIYTHPFLYITTSGTGTCKDSTLKYRDVSCRLPKPNNSYADYQLSEDIISAECAENLAVILATCSLKSNYRNLNNIISSDGAILVAPALSKVISKLVLGVSLVDVNGQLFLKVRCKFDTSNNVDNNGSEIADYYLNHKPLIK
mgnify:FL=1